MRRQVAHEQVNKNARFSAAAHAEQMGVQIWAGPFRCQTANITCARKWIPRRSTRRNDAFDYGKACLVGQSVAAALRNDNAYSVRGLPSDNARGGFGRVNTGWKKGTGNNSARPPIAARHAAHSGQPSRSISSARARRPVCQRLRTGRP